MVIFIWLNAKCFLMYRLVDVRRMNCLFLIAHTFNTHPWGMRSLYVQHQNVKKHFHCSYPLTIVFSYDINVQLNQSSDNKCNTEKSECFVQNFNTLFTWLYSTRHLVFVWFAQCLKLWWGMSPYVPNRNHMVWGCMLGTGELVLRFDQIVFFLISRCGMWLDEVVKHLIESLTGLWIDVIDPTYRCVICVCH